MTFANLLFLIGTLAVAGPLVAHLFARPRFKRVPFTMMRFLEAGHKQTQTQRRLRDLLLLAMRMLILVLLTLAFADPVLVDRQPPSGRTIHFLAIDDSLSMAYREGGSTLLEQAKSAARAAIASAGPEAVFTLHGLASGVQAEARPAGDALAFIEALTPVPARINLEPFTAAVEKAVDARERVHVTLASDFTPPVLDALHAGAPVPVSEVRALRAGTGATVVNASVTGCSVSGITGDEIRFATLCVNNGTEPLDTAVRIVLDGLPSSPVAVRLAPGERRAVPIDAPLPAGAENLAVTVQLDGEDNLPEDDAYFCGLWLPRIAERNILIVAQDARQGHLFRAALEVLSSGDDAAGTFRVSQVTPQAFDGRLLAAMDVVIFAAIPRTGAPSDAAREFLHRGGRLLFFLSTPHDAEALQGWADAGTAPAAALAFHETPARLRDRPIFLSGDPLDPSGGTAATLANYELSQLALAGFFELRLAPSAEVLWTFERDHPFLVAARAGDGVAVVVNTSADDRLGPLMKSSAAVALCHYLIGGHRARQLNGFAADEPVTLPATDMEMKAAGSDRAQWAVLPDRSPAKARISGEQILLDPPLQTGFVSTKGVPVRYAGVNVPAEELDLRRPTAEDIDAAITARYAADGARAAGETVVRTREDRSLWRWFMAAALGMVVAEAFVSNRMKR